MSGWNHSLLADWTLTDPSLVNRIRSKEALLIDPEIWRMFSTLYLASQVSVPEHSRDPNKVGHLSMAGLSLLGYPGLGAIDPTYCLPRRVVEKLGIARRSYEQCF
jgi:hypothetical protein